MNNLKITPLKTTKIKNGGFQGGILYFVVVNLQPIMKMKYKF